MINVGIYGADGRMGKTISLLLEDSKMSLASILYSINDDFISKNSNATDSLKELFDKSDVIIDFSLPDGTKKLLEHNCKVNNPKPLVIGTTGLGSLHLNLMEDISSKVPLLYSSNMSLGVSALDMVASKLSNILRDFDIEISEIHHKFKKDIPSGTALMLANDIALSRSLNPREVIKIRDKDSSLRKKDEIGISSMRGGDIRGKHTIGFYSDGEHIELTHTASSRDIFARGAIKSAIWVVKQKPKLYRIKDMFNI